MKQHKQADKQVLVWRTGVRPRCPMMRYGHLVPDIPHLARLLSDRYLRDETRNQIRQQRLERMRMRFLGSHDECGLVNTKNNRIRLLKTNTRLSNTSTKIDWTYWIEPSLTYWYNGRGPFIWQTETSDWLSYSRRWLVNLDPRLTRESTCVCLPLTYMLKVYSLDARIASIGSQLIDRVLENPHNTNMNASNNNHSIAQ